jgi:hypothetical protein
LRPNQSPRGQFAGRCPAAHLLKSLAALLAQSGANWVKFPVWYREEDVVRADELSWSAERLGSLGIEMVGVLDQPPPDIRDRFGGRGPMPVASLFLEPALWQPAVDPVLSRLALKVKWWQLGADDDLSFVGYPNLEKKVAEIRKHLERFGQEIQVVLPWNAVYEPVVPKAASWAALSHHAEPAFTASEIAAHLSGASKRSLKHWVILQPLARSDYSVETRARDLVDRMLAAKVERADGAFLPDPFDVEHGLLNADGTPGELLLPWRTTSQMISGAIPGRIDLP